MQGVWRALREFFLSQETRGCRSRQTHNQMSHRPLQPLISKGKVKVSWLTSLALSTTSTLSTGKLSAETSFEKLP